MMIQNVFLSCPRVTHRGELDRCGESQGWTSACSSSSSSSSSSSIVFSSSLSKRDGEMERIAQNKYARSCWFARHIN